MFKKNKKLDSLEKALLNMKVGQLSNVQKNNIKSVVFKRCNFDLAENLLNLDEFNLSQIAKISVKERVFDVIDTTVNGFVFGITRLVRLTASFALFSFAFFIVFNFMTLEQDVVFANHPSIYKNVIGDVLVERNGEILHIEEGMYVVEGDRIRTNGGGVAIRFFDDTESRIGKSSEVVIDKLYTDEENDVLTEVEISVIAGDVWSNVINLVGDSEFSVKSDNVEAVVESRAAFNVQVKPDYSSVEVYDDVVKVKANDFEGHVVSGNVVAVDDGENIDIDVVDNDWVAVNLNEDVEHKISVDEEVLGAKIDVVAGLGEVALNEESLDIGISDVDDLKEKFDVVEKQFITADVQLITDNSDVEVAEAVEVMSEFYDEVEDYYIEIDELRDENENLADELETYLNGRLEVLEKSVVLSEPGSPEYLGVEVIDSLKVVAAFDDEVALADIKVSIGLAKLAGVDEIIDSGDMNLAGELLENGVSEIDSAAEFVSDEIMGDYLVALDVAQGFEEEIQVIVDGDEGNLVTGENISDDSDEIGDFNMHNSGDEDGKVLENGIEESDEIMEKSNVSEDEGVVESELIEIDE